MKNLSAVKKVVCYSFAITIIVVADVGVQAQEIDVDVSCYPNEPGPAPAQENPPTVDVQETTGAAEEIGREEPLEAESAVEEHVEYNADSDDQEIAQLDGDNNDEENDPLAEELPPHWSECEGFAHVLSVAKTYNAALRKPMRVCAICGERIQTNLLTDVDKQTILKRWLICGPDGISKAAERKMNESFYPQYPDMNRYRKVCVKCQVV